MTTPDQQERDPFASRPKCPACPKCGAEMWPSFSLMTFWCDACGHVNDPEKTRGAVERRKVGTLPTPLQAMTDHDE